MEMPLFAMIAHSGWTARLVLLILLGFSIMTWVIIINRYYFLRYVSSGDRQFRGRFAALRRLAETGNIDRKYMTGPMAQLGEAAAAEYQRIAADVHTLGTGRDAKGNRQFFLQSHFAIAAERMGSACAAITGTFDRGVFLLAMVSSVSPFLGLLGTVWGIMNSFYEIGNQGSASLPVVAPGIAEALVATLAGLAVAIPALMFYNYFMHRAERIETDMEEFRDVLLARIKRETLDDFFSGERENV
jgi:biopolymer transport protein TolQ